MADNGKPKAKGPIKVGETVVCTKAHSPWYTTGQTYEVIEHPETGTPALRAADGLLDHYSLLVSSFRRA